MSTTRTDVRSGVSAGKQKTPLATNRRQAYTPDYSTLDDLHRKMRRLDNDLRITHKRLKSTMRRLRAAESYADMCTASIAFLLVLLIISVATNFWAASALMAVAQ